MHRAFQHDLCKLRLTVTRAYVKLLSTNPTENNVSGEDCEFKLNATVSGIINHTLKLEIQNLGGNLQKDIIIIVQANRDVYTVINPVIEVPIVLPEGEHQFLVPVYRVQGTTLSDDVLVFLSRGKTSGSLKPLLTARVKMPLACA